jgi:hypothetical protein
LGEIAVEMHFLRRYDEKIPAVKIVERVADKEAAGTVLHIIDFVVIVEMVFHHLVFCFPGALIGVYSVDGKV